MEQLAKLRFFCSHNCFEVFDSGVEPWGEPTEKDGLSSEEVGTLLDRGWYRGGGGSIVYRTVAHSNDHRIDVFRAPEAHIHEDADRVMVHNLSLPSGKLVIFGLDTGEQVNVGAGEYVLQCRAYHIGVDMPFDNEFRRDDAAFLTRDDLERYELILTPGRTEREGVVFGPATLDSFYARRSI
ncbi:MAG TPA: hypothetical protein VGI81_04605 [Tepidisphaeraceae bacterium]|jgi:hypothetical protein